MYVLISYDVVDGRTETFRKILTRYLIHEQKSVFAGTIEEAQLIRLRKELQGAMIPADNVLEVVAANKNNVGVSCLKKSSGNASLVSADHNHHREKSTVI